MSALRIASSCFPTNRLVSSRLVETQPAIFLLLIITLETALGKAYCQLAEP
jgi:hypothetical protein